MLLLPLLIKEVAADKASSGVRICGGVTTVAVGIRPKAKSEQICVTHLIEGGECMGCFREGRVCGAYQSTQNNKSNCKLTSSAAACPHRSFRVADNEMPPAAATVSHHAPSLSPPSRSVVDSQQNSRSYVVPEFWQNYFANI